MQHQSPSIPLARHRLPALRLWAALALVALQAAILAPFLGRSAYAASFPSKVTLTHGGGGGDSSYGTTYGYSINVKDTITYCAQACAYAAPDGTKFSVREVSEVLSKKKAHRTKLVAYYGYGGAGFDAKYFMKHFGTDFTGDGDEHNYYFGTHLLFSQAVTGTTGDAYADDWDDACDDFIALLEERRQKQGVNVDALEVYIFNEDASTQTHVAYVTSQTAPPDTGALALEKRCSETALVQGNPCYTLKGAAFDVYSDAACTKRVGTLTTDEHGATGTLEDLTPGTYHVRETTAPAGYLLDGTTHAVEVKGGETTTVAISDVPAAASGGLGIVKADEQTGQAVAQGDASLAGAVFEVSHYGNTDGKAQGTPLRTWRFATDAHGHMDLASTKSRIGGDDLYTTTSGSVALPLGTYVLREVEAPSGYRKAAGTYVGVVRLSDGKAAWSSEGWSLDAPAAHEVDGRGVAEAVKSGGMVVRKIDRERDEAVPQGDATLEGAEFTIYNRSKAAVVVGGTVVSPGAAAKVIVTGADGVARTGAHDLPYGTYEVRETKAPRGYLPNEEWSATVEIHEDGRVTEVEDPCGEQVVRGGVRVGKTSAEPGTYDEQGAGSLEGATFTVVNLSPNAVLVNGALVDPGAVALTLTTAEQDGRYVAESAPDALPYGTYRVTETRVERTSGYLRNRNWEQTFEIRAQGDVASFVEEDDACPNQISRNDLCFVKRDDATGSALAHVPFLLSSDTTGEAHVIVTDDNGHFDTRLVPHSQDTNANDGSLGEDGSVDEAALNPEAGVWFSGLSDQEVDPSDELGALPYDTYTLQELPCAVNEGLELVRVSVSLRYHDGYALDWGTIDDQPAPQISTVAAGASGAHEMPAEDTLELTDTVTYVNLVPGETYTMTGTLMDKESGSELLDAHGRPVSAQTEFTPKTSEGTVQLVFSFDAPEGLAGRRIVVFERCEREGTEVATHADLEDVEQTVTPLRIGTTLVDEEGRKAVSAAEQVNLIDTVTYEGLVPEASYTLVGTLVSGADGTPIRAIPQATTTFQPEASSGTSEVRFSFDARDLPTGTLVSFERLYDANGALVARHEDPHDEGQTVTIPQIRTNACDQQTGLHEGCAQGTRTIVDTITYQGLVPGREYEVAGTLHLRAEDGSDAGELKDGEGHAIAAQRTFTPEHESGTVELSFTFDAALVAGRSVVAFEHCTQEGREVAVHADISDEDQTVCYPHIATTLATTDGAKRVEPGKVTLVDTVSYEGLEPGRTYTMSGTLMNAQTGEPVPDATASDTFVPTEESGSFLLSLPCDLTRLGGVRVVAFERLTRTEGDQDMLVASHEDLDDQGQSVEVGSPALATTLTDKTDGDHTIVATGTANVVDTVSYQDLTPGTTYVMTGTLHLKKGKEDGGVLKSGGKAVTATKTFTPKKTHGTVKLSFAFDATALDGHDAVAFEVCTLGSAEGPVVATHEDITDAGQTVSPQDKPKEPTAKRDPVEHLPQTGRFPRAYMLIAGGFSLALAGALGGAWRARTKRMPQQARRRRYHYHF